MPEDERLQTAYAAALAAADRVEPEPTAVVEYHSRGALLIVGPRPVAMETAARLAGRPPLVLATDEPAKADAEVDPIPGVQVVYGRPVSIAGHLGQFRVLAEAHSRHPRDAAPLDLGPLSPNRDGLYDLILDLEPRPTLKQELPPLGYFPTGGDPARLATALEQLPGLMGEFEKPRFFAYDPDLCAHSRRGLHACRRCIDACPAEAIRSIGEQVEVDPYLCQGGGGCATVCPSGAMTYAYPSPADSRARVRALLHHFRDAGGADARLCLYAAEAGANHWRTVSDQLGPRALPLAVEELAASGMDLWLSALAYGANQVWLLLDDGIPSRSETALRGQVEIARTLLAGMGQAADRIRMRRTQDPIASETEFPDPTPARFAPLNDKRTALFLALDHLYASAPKPRPFIDLPGDAPFGTVQLDPAACTLCLACVAVCPGKALRDGDDHPALRFVEANCLQCGMCTRACPEDAIWISPRMLYDADARRQARVLKEEEPFTCIQCGKPFSTKSMVDRLTKQLGGHYMFQGEAIKRLQMCEDCRVRSMLANDQGEEWFSRGPGAIGPVPRSDS